MNPSLGLHAGSARTDISPPPGIFLIGYGDREQGCQSIHDDLTATAICLDDGATQLAIITLDILALNEHVVKRIRAGISTQYRIPASQVMICCSHTHSGPITYADQKSAPQNRAYIDGLVDQLTSLVGLARRRRQPARVAHGQGEAHIAVNRRQVQPDGSVVIGVNPDGPVDRSLNVLRLILDGTAVAMHKTASVLPAPKLLTLVNFACHPTILGPANNQGSADWPGEMRREVEKNSGGWCMFLQGAAGDLNPNHEWGEHDWATVERLGHQVAAAVIDTLDCKMQSMPAVPLAAQSQALSLPLVPQFRSDGTPITYQEALAQQLKLPQAVVDPLLDSRFPWRNSLAGSAGTWATPMEIQGFRIGDMALVAHAAEIFNEIGVAVKRDSPVPLTWFTGYSNGCIGYLPTAAAHALGGYEVELAPYFYRLPGLMDPGCAALAADHSLRMIDQLFAA